MIGRLHSVIRWPWRNVSLMKEARMQIRGISENVIFWLPPQATSFENACGLEYMDRQQFMGTPTQIQRNYKWENQSSASLHDVLQGKQSAHPAIEASEATVRPVSKQTVDISLKNRSKHSAYLAFRLADAGIHHTGTKTAESRHEIVH
ncbi:hypothetical protein CDAR_168331 [Caerostris darwini]|uniref:Uncharacterized protein n=1 Tax=Caerostris darwini TaxID=1538125 RepID=A0AAV4T8B5_9ARAC|nr:hypothetical protein CDAR_168331 [Caerostris darwini]